MQTGLKVNLAIDSLVDSDRPWTSSWTYIFMAQIKTGANVLSESSDRTRICRWT